ncbi:MAG TPA: hypothetical protein VHJ20_08475 [Polyangia bacterium]|nr:hypothetical protein [Polyangia bacterium]
MDTAHEPEAGPDLLTRPRAPSSEFRASLEAVRTAQAAARARARTETRWTRVFAVGALMSMGVTAWAAARHPAKHAAVPTVEVAPPAAPSEAPTVTPPAPVAAIAAPAAVVSSPADVDAKVAGCDAAVEQRNWPAVAAACAGAFEARHDGALAMRIAQAEHRRGHLDVAADWARKALALDAKIPEAYVLVARADVAAGQRRDATDAYKRYLELAPRGWHAAEARRALR